MQHARKGEKRPPLLCALRTEPQAKNTSNPLTEENRKKVRDLRCHADNLKYCENPEFLIDLTRAEEFIIYPSIFKISRDLAEIIILWKKKFPKLRYLYESHEIFVILSSSFYIYIILPFN